jgi:hypothetical protein
MNQEDLMLGHVADPIVVVVMACARPLLPAMKAFKRGCWQRQRRLLVAFRDAASLYVSRVGDFSHLAREHLYLVVHQNRARVTRNANELLVHS